MTGTRPRQPSPENVKPCVFLVSPFVDKQHGTERRVAEWIPRLADDFQIYIYSQRVDDIDLSNVVWRRIPRLPGPHIFNYLWWFIANRVWRTWDRRFRGVQPDIVFSPGINCLDADVVSVHVVFAEYVERFEEELRLSRTQLSAWGQAIHRKVYYRLIAFLESRVYRNQRNSLVLIAKRTSSELERHFGRRGPFPVIYVGLDHHVFNPTRRNSLREIARKELGYDAHRFVLLLIGNDWKNKGLPSLIEAVAFLAGLPVEILAVGRENPADYEKMVRSNGLENRLKFQPPRRDVEFYYAAADAYVGASIEDTFAQPPAEAMACGLPVIVSSTNGTSEIIEDGVNGLILKDANDSVSLSQMIRQLYEDAILRERLGKRAAQAAQRYTWDQNAHEFRAVLHEALQKKEASAMRVPVKGS